MNKKLESLGEADFFEIRRNSNQIVTEGTGVYVPIIQTTIVRVSLNDGNKFDYFWFQILPLSKWHRNRSPSEAAPSKRVESARDHFPWVGAAGFSGEFILRLNRKLVNVLGLRCLGSIQLSGISARG